MAVDKIQRRTRIKRGIASKLRGTASLPRLSVFRSNKSIYVQVIDDINGQTLAAANSRQLGVKGNTTIKDSKNVGLKIAEAAKAAGIEKVVFDRSGYRYHGNVKALAEGAREGGLVF
jgi:large subunit ribosomal protein L18